MHCQKKKKKNLLKIKPASDSIAQVQEATVTPSAANVELIVVQLLAGQ